MRRDPETPWLVLALIFLLMALMNLSILFHASEIRQIRKALERPEQTRNSK